MSDDDCDIFNMPTKRPNAVPQKMHLPMEQETKEADYDFIELPIELRKPVPKVNRTVVKEPKPKARTGKRKKAANDAEANNNQNTEYKTDEAPAPPTRELSPVSQMIFEMEQKKVKSKAKSAKDIIPDGSLDNLPVARRTRSSLGGQKAGAETGPSVEPQPLTSPIKRQKLTTRKSLTAKTTAPRATAAKTKAPKATAPKKTTTRGGNQQITDFLNQTATRGTRREVAELAARSQVLDSIDLVSAVMPRVEGFVNLDSDDEGSAPEEMEKSTIQSKDADNPEIDINLSWLGEIQMYKLRQHQKFSHMFKEISERNKVPIDDIVINMDDRFITPAESPDNVGLKIYHILTGCAMKSSKTKVLTKEDTNPLSKPKKFQLKVQGDKWKKPLIIPLKKSETFKILYIKCAEEMECDMQDLKLFFDGDFLELDDTPKNQEMEGNEMIDLRMK